MEVCWMEVDISQPNLSSLHMGQNLTRLKKKETNTASNNKYNNNILPQKMGVK